MKKIKKEIATNGLKAQNNLAQGKRSVALGLIESHEFAPCKGNRYSSWGNEQANMLPFQGDKLRITINPGFRPGLESTGLSGRKNEKFLPAAGNVELSNNNP